MSKNNKNNDINKSSVQTKDGELILDSHKLSYHYERIEAWENGEKIAPVSVDMALSRACGAMCSFCYAMIQEPQERASIKTKDALNLLVKFSFDELRIHQLYGNVLEDNLASICLFKSVGFMKVGLKKEWRCYKSVFKNEYLFQLINYVL